MYEYIDVHAHIGDASFDLDRNQVVSQAKNVIILEAGLEHQSNVKALQLADQYSNVRACLGFHPEFVVKASQFEVDMEIEFIRKHATKIVAISEIGLDYKYGSRAVQATAFSKLMQLAAELRLPVVLHSRWAAGAVLDAIRGFDVKIDLHAFSGNLSEVERAIDAGYFLSIGPNIVFNEYRQKLASLIPLENTLTETDSPVLGPKPRERNAPVNIRLAVEKIAEVKGLTTEEVREAVYRNAQQVFAL
jgi:TatD DNase family protein